MSTISTRLPECRQRCEALLTQYGLQGCTRMSLAVVRSELPYFLLRMWTNDEAYALFEEIRLVSHSVDQLVLALDAALRAQLWPAREGEA